MKNNVNKLKLYGCFLPMGLYPSFGIPVFSDGKNKWVQEVDKINDQLRIKKFKLLDPDHEKEIILIRKRLFVRKGDQPIYSFIDKNRNIIVGIKSTLDLYFIKTKDKFKNYPFLRLDILSFLNEGAQGVRDQIYEIQNILSGNDEQLAKEWALIQRKDFQLKEDENFTLSNLIPDVEFPTIQNGFFGFWDLDDVLKILLRKYSQVYAKFELVRSIIGKPPKIKKLIRSMGISSYKINHEGYTVMLNKSSYNNFKSIHRFVMLTELKVYGEKIVTIKVADKLTVRKRYFKKNTRKIRKKSKNDYIINMI